MSLFHDVSNFAGRCQPVQNILHGQFCTAYTIFGAYFTCLLTSLSRMWLSAALAYMAEVAYAAGPALQGPRALGQNKKMCAA